MAGIEVSSRQSGRRALNRDIPLIPFIDFLLCLISFLLITAVWSQMGRLEASARVPGNTEGLPTVQDDKVLHVQIRPSQGFTLAWKTGATVVDSIEVPRKAIESGDFLDYPDLRTAVREQWARHGDHRSPSDTKLDQAVLHASNAAEFQEIAAVIDALHEPKREFTQGSTTRRVPAFNVTFAVN